LLFARLFIFGMNYCIAELMAESTVVFHAEFVDQPVQLRVGQAFSKSTVSHDPAHYLSFV